MNAGTDILQHALDLTRCNGEADKRTSGRKIVGLVCEQLGLSSASHRLILQVLSVEDERPRVPMALVYRYLGVTYRTWRRWMLEDRLFQGLEVTYRNSKNALLYVDELEAIFAALNRRRGTAYTAAGLVGYEKAPETQKQKTMKQAVA